MTKRYKIGGLVAPNLAQTSDRERISYTLSLLLWVLFAVSTVIAITTVFAGLPYAVLLSSIGAVVMVMLLLVMRRGHLGAASVLLTLTWIIIGTAALLTGDGIHDVAIIIFPTVLITAGLLLSRALYIVMSVAAVISVALAGAIEVMGVIETPFSTPDRWGDVAIASIILSCVAILVRFLTDALRHSLDRAQKSEENFRGVFNATREAIIIHDADSGEIVDVNESFLSMTGLEKDQAVALPAELVYGDAVDWEQIRLPESPSPEVIECNLAVQTVVSPRIEVTFRRSTIGGRRLVLAVARDITARRRLEDRLRQSEKMQAVGQLAGGIAHDFNNQLVGIVGYADLLRTKLAEHPELEPYAANILRSARRASDLTAHLLAFARKGKVLTARVDLHDIISEVVELLERSIDKTIHVALELGASPPTALGDPTQLQNCFLNLALNARDAMPDGGEMKFSTRVVSIDEDECRANPYDISAGDYVEVAVSDTGVGMSPLITERIFEPFFTTKEEEKGTGMGLAAVYGTVKNHKGTISVTSEEGRGATFRVSLPLLNEATSPRVVESEASPLQTSQRAHILLVDDEEQVCDITSEMLRALGHRVSVCRNGREAVDLFQTSAEKIDLVILDMIMPVMGGRATYDALRKIAPTVRVLLASGYSLDGDAQAILDRGARGFVQKPFLKTELGRAVLDALTTES